MNTKEEPKQEPCDNCNNDICCCIIKKQETLEEAAERYAKSVSSIKPFFRENTKKTFIEAAKYQQERSYSEDEVMNILKERDLHNIVNMGGNNTWIDRPEWFEKFRKQ